MSNDGFGSGGHLVAELAASRRHLRSFVLLFLDDDGGVGGIDAVEHGQLGPPHLGVEEPAGRIAVHAHHVHKRRQLIAAHAERLAQLVADLARHEAAMRPRVASAIAIAAAASIAAARVATRVELRLLVRLRRLRVEHVAVDGDALVVDAHRTVVDAMVGRQAVEALERRTLGAQSLGQRVVLGERQADRVLVLALVSLLYYMFLSCCLGD